MALDPFEERPGPEEATGDADDPVLEAVLAASVGVFLALEARAVKRLVERFDRERQALAGRLLLPQRTNARFGVRQMQEMIHAVEDTVRRLREELPRAGNAAVHEALRQGAAAGMTEVGAGRRTTRSASTCTAP